MLDSTIKNIKNLSLFGIIPIIFAIVIVGIYLERYGFKNTLLRNIFLVLLAVLAVLSIILLYLHAPAKDAESFTEKQTHNATTQPTCG